MRRKEDEKTDQEKRNRLADVWNNDDGTVEILAQSDNAEKLAKFIQEIRKGPSPFSKVTYVDVNIANFSDYHDFRMAN